MQKLGSYTDSSPTPIGWWKPADNPSSVLPLEEALRQVDRPVFVVRKDEGPAAAVDGCASIGSDDPADTLPLLAVAPALTPEALGDPSFCRDHGVRYPLVGGSMAKGISSEALVEGLAKEGMLGFFGAAGLTLQRVEAAIERLQTNLKDLSFGFNLIHSPNEPDLEAGIVDLYIHKGVRLVEASAYLDLTLPVVRYRVHGIHRDPSGAVVTPNRLVAKVSREEVAAKFLAPPPEKFLKELVAAGEITAEQAEMAATIPMAQDVTAEADSGGHTDNRPALALFPTIAAVRDAAQKQYTYPVAPRVGLGGGIGTPVAAASAFALGAAYVVTGSVNQACVESGTSDEVRRMLAETRQADVTLAPAADMFEMGVTVQVLKRGTMFSMRAYRLYELYKSCASLDDIPPPEREKLEKTVFKAPLTEIWSQTRAFFLKRDPSQATRAESDPKHKMALVFRWYLGQAPHWANDGDLSRKIDFQIWCGPAMGAFNEWARGTFLEAPAVRRIGTVALNLLYGAAVITRANALRAQGITIPPSVLRSEPLEETRIKEYLR